jgi:hypothetical protein
MRWKNMSPLSLLKNLWHRAGKVQHIVTQHTVRCPEHDYDATIVVHTKASTQRGRRHVNVIDCLLFPHEPVYPPTKIDWVPDLPYYAIPRYPARHTPVYDPRVPCRKHCLYALNHAAETGKTRQGRCMSGSIDCLELERQATHNTVAESATTQTPWSYV